MKLLSDNMKECNYCKRVETVYGSIRHAEWNKMILIICNFVRNIM